MKPYQQLIQNLVSRHGWGEPEKTRDSDYDWRFTNIDGRVKNFEAELQDAYELLMREEGISLWDLEGETWIALAKQAIANAPFELEIDDNPDQDTWDHGDEPGAWVNIKGRVWIPLDDAVEMTKQS